MSLAVLILLSNYTHDLATGLMFGSVIAYFIAAGVLRRSVSAERLARALADLYRRFRPVVLWSLAAVLGLGVPRMIFYHEFEWLPAAGRGQIAALVVKHVVLVSVTVTSLVLFFRSAPKADESVTS